jgi:hypothetical protein
MAAIPTIAEVDARRPNREHENLVGERARIVNRMKATLARSVTLSPVCVRHQNISKLFARRRNTASIKYLCRMLREMARLRFITEQMKAIENERLHQLEQAPARRQNAMVRLLARVIGIGIEAADMLVNKVLARIFAIGARWPATPVSPARQTTAPEGNGRRGLHEQGMHGSAAAWFNLFGVSSCSRRTAHWRGGTRPNCRRAWRHPQNDDCGFGAQADRCSV